MSQSLIQIRRRLVSVLGEINELIELVDMQMNSGGLDTPALPSSSEGRIIYKQPKQEQFSSPALEQSPWAKVEVSPKVTETFHHAPGISFTVLEDEDDD